MINVRYVHPARLLTKQQTECLTSRYTPVIPLSELTALVEGLRDIIGQAHGGAMLGGDDAYTACLRIEVQAHTILTQLEAHRREG